MNGDVYVKLREFLDTLGSGYPATPTGVELKILKKLFSPDEAELTMKLNKEPEELSAIAARLGEKEKALGSQLEDMAQKGLIYRVKKEGKTYYSAVQFIIGIYEFQLKTLDKEFSQMIEEYIPHYGMSLMSVKTKQLRVIPVESSVDSSTKIETYNKIRILFNTQDKFSVAPCICRKEQDFLGKKCTRPVETCIGLGEIAEYYIENKMARPISREDALKLIDQAEESALVLCPTNSQEILSVCCCCPCCCPTLKYSKMMPRPVDFILSYYQASIDPEVCIACGQCIQRCQMGAVKAGKDSSEMIDGRCIGCGLCIAGCPTEAISLMAKEEMRVPPQDFMQGTLKNIEAERGVC